MPIRELQCRNKECLERSEIILKIDKQAQCPVCKSYEVEVLTSLTAPARFNGGGWTPKHYG